MILAVDSSALALIINPDANPPAHPETGEAVVNAAARVAAFLASLSRDDAILVPAPVLAEILVVAEDGGPELLATISNSAKIKIKPFGQRAAIETAAMTREAIANGNKRSPGANGTSWAKIKYDRQIIAIARVEQATQIYADDEKLIQFARKLGMEVFSTWDLPEPPKPPQIDMFGN